MADAIDLSTVRRMAALGRLALSASEAERFRADLAEILDYFKRLDQVDTTGVEPLAHPLAITNVFREDQPEPPLPLPEALANAPVTNGSLFEVPRVLDNSKQS